MTGVPPGFTHNWSYRGHWKERKIKPGLWKGRFKATKRTKAKSLGPKPGSKLTWNIKGKQTARKTGKGEYQTTFDFTKKLVNAKIR